MTITKRIPVLFLTFFLTLPVLGVFAQSGIMKELSGTVELKFPNAQDFIPAKTGDRISQDTVISTGFKSSALVEVGNAIITVRPLTLLTLKEIGSDSRGENLSMSLRSGRVRVELTPPAGTKASMSVSSPAATASVRGTIFEFDTRNIYVERGAVAFKGSYGGLTRVNAGFRGQLDNSGKVYNPVDTMNSGLLPRVPVGSDLTWSAANRTWDRSEANLTVTTTYQFP
ncbi:MAG: FecR domain-containing protein [Treponema sp.]|jgi:hypothetical protein|nr:FecR domain-containing protein [Treponema sp.]